ncbi:MAG: serine/threonine-protein kinase, partial [Rhodothermales bacterium]|nr:serine/threonine-protein kinase [Rhodothermales bacterium]
MNDLSPERWQEIDALFAEALDRPPDERTAYLRRACGHDPALYHEVLALLASADEAEHVLGESVTQYAAPLLPGLSADLSAPDPLPGGGRIGPYRLVGEIGRGGMGAVYRAERADGAFEQTVALKLVKRGMDTDEILRRFRHERQILASLDHPNVARLLDGGAADDGRPYLVMEYVEGTRIDHFCDARALPIPARLRLFLAAGEAVQYAHQNLVVHRDLKPSNILVT